MFVTTEQAMTLSDRIRRFGDGIVGETVPRSDVTDVLLDLRLDAGDRPGITQVIDRVLTDMPGRNVVLSSWWRDQIELLALEADRETAAA